MELTEQEKEYIQERKKEFEQEYPYLKEVGMQKILREALIIEILLERTNEEIFKGGMDKDVVKVFDTLNRTYALLLSRMGITLVSRHREKEKGRPKTPLQFLEEERENE